MRVVERFRNHVLKLKTEVAFATSVFCHKTCRATYFFTYRIGLSSSLAELQKARDASGKFLKIGERSLDEVMDSLEIKVKIIVDENVSKARHGRKSLGERLR
jgi:hypothetical protein